ncbi:hypothetical protein FQA47_008676 [Oryzias melastigma]|uniref:Uncharacterized protein n=1 Tax=Oryzias melastigma TaxID=30732 RepID=A0A834FD67_ORYME|nr:hypothetical protein FQA47_008676 [Oryzias melastigma]
MAQRLGILHIQECATNTTALDVCASAASLPRRWSRSGSASARVTGGERGTRDGEWGEKSIEIQTDRRREILIIARSVCACDSSVRV